MPLFSIQTSLFVNHSFMHAVAEKIIFLAELHIPRTQFFRKNLPLSHEFSVLPEFLNLIFQAGHFPPDERDGNHT